MEESNIFAEICCVCNEDIYLLMIELKKCNVLEWRLFK